MKKRIFFGILAILFAGFLAGGSIYLWNWNINTTGAWFAVAMCVLGFGILSFSIVHFYINNFKNRK